MSNKTQLQTNNTKLASLIQTLQGKAAGGGGGGTSIETCTVSVTRDEDYGVLSVRMDDGLPVPYYAEETSTVTWTAPCGTMVLVGSSFSITLSCTNATYLGIDYGNYLDYLVSGTMGNYKYCHLVRIDAQSGETASIDIMEAT